jgi:Flp pilus assembly protein TadD
VSPDFKFVKKFLVISVYSVLTLSTLLVFRQVRNFDFANYDDNYYVSENQHVLNGLTLDGIIWAFTTNLTGYWHPLTWLSLMLDCQLFGPNPGPIHLINVLLHLANTLLLFAVLKKMTGSLWPSAFVAAAFALHPMHVESVAWIAERKDVLSTFFLLLTLAAYAGYVSRPSVFRYIAALAAFALGLMAKPMLVTLPFMLLLLDYWPLNRFERQPAKVQMRQAPQNASGAYKRSVWHQIIIEKIPFFVLSAIISVLTFWIQRSLGIAPDVTRLPLESRVANVFLSYVRYIGKMFWPQNLAAFYPFDIGGFPFWQVVLCALLLLVISILVIYFGGKRRYLIVGWFWFIGILVPVIGLIQSGGQGWADRYTYISYIGLFIMIAWGLPELLSKWPYRKIALGIAAAMVLTAMGIGTCRQVGYWKNNSTLFTHAVEVTQNNYIAHNDFGVAYGKLGRWQDAIEAYKQAIRIKPDYADAHYNLGVAYGKLGRYQDAVEAYKQAIRINPDFAEAHDNLGNIYGKRGRYQDAAEAFKQAIRIKPDFADAHYNLGVTYFMTDDKGSALEEYKILKTLDAEQANKLFNLINK